MALLISEPMAVAAASLGVRNEIEVCFRKQILPSQRSRLINLHRVLCIHQASRRALGLDNRRSLHVNDIIDDTPDSLARVWVASRELRKHARSACTFDLYFDL